MAIINTAIRSKVQGARLTPYPLPLTTGSRGFALLIAVVFMSVILAFGLALGALAYKQQVLAASAVQSQYAFYAADAALECVLYADEQLGLFAYPSRQDLPVPVLNCDGASSIQASQLFPPNQFYVTSRLSLDSNKRCADVSVYKPDGAGTTFIFSQGYDVPCSVVDSPSGARYVSRGIMVHY